MTTTLNPKLRKLVEQLEAAIGDDRTFAIVEKIKRDTTIKSADAIAMAHALTSIRARSKRDALDLLSWQHRNVVGARARARATNGRTAA